MKFLMNSKGHEKNYITFNIGNKYRKCDIYNCPVYKIHFNNNKS